MNRARGFTLVEVMVALAVVAIALPALLLALSQHVDATGHLRDKSLAQLVAANKMEDLRILTHATRSMLRGQDSGVSEMLGRDWYWWLDSQPTEQANFYRVEIEVAAEEELRDQPLFSLVAFFSADFQQGQQQDQQQDQQQGQQQGQQRGQQEGESAGQ